MALFRRILSLGKRRRMEQEIEAELWGQPVAQQLLMNTRIDLDTGQVSLKEGGR